MAKTTTRTDGTVIALAWPGPTALVLVLIVGVWAVIAGLAEFFAAFASGEPAGTRAAFILGGLATIAFGVVLCARPGIGTITLALDPNEKFAYHVTKVVHNCLLGDRYPPGQRPLAGTLANTWPKDIQQRVLKRWQEYGYR